MKKYAIIVAAGSGSRMGTDTPKQYLELAGKPVIVHAIQSFAETFPDISIILVVHRDFIARTSELISGHVNLPAIKVVPGGSTRFASVKAGLMYVPDGAIVFVHDSVRCLLSQNLINRCYIAAMEKGNAIPAIAAVDSVRIASAEGNKPVERNSVRLVQTPQTFHSTILKQAYEDAQSDNFTDDAAVAESAGVSINLIEGETTNIKITHPVDLIIARRILEERAIALGK